MQMFTVISLIVIQLVVCVESARILRLDKREQWIAKRGGPARAGSLADQTQTMIDEMVEDGHADSVSDAHGNALTKLEKFEDREGNKILHADQKFKGVKVLGGRVADVELKQRKKTLYSKQTNQPTGKKYVFQEREEFGQVVDGIEMDLPADLDPTNYRPDEAVRNLTSKAKGNVELEQGETVIFVDDNDNNKAKVGYVVSIFDNDNGQPSMPTQLVDADTHQVIAEWDSLQTWMPPAKTRPHVVEGGEGPGGNTKTGKYEFGVDKTKYYVTDLGYGRCRMETKQVKTINLEKNPANTYKINDAWEFKCFDQEGDQTNGAFSPLNDATSFGEKIYQMYLDWYGEPPLRNADGTAMQLIMKMHFSDNWENAAWNGQFMLFGDGGSRYYPMVSLDIASHEIAHGVTAMTSALEYRGESGGLNEAFADMAGKAAERYARGANGVKWTVGSDIVKDATGSLRRMDEPWKGKSGQEIGHIRDYNSSVSVHQSSGIFNRAFFLMSQKFDNDVWDAFDLFYVANTRYWTSSTTFTGEQRRLETPRLLALYYSNLTKYLGRRPPFELEDICKAYEVILPYAMAFYVFGVPLMCNSPVIEGPNKEQRKEEMLVRARDIIDDVIPLKKWYDQVMALLDK